MTDVLLKITFVSVIYIGLKL